MSVLKLGRRRWGRSGRQIEILSLPADCGWRDYTVWSGWISVLTTFSRADKLQTCRPVITHTALKAWFSQRQSYTVVKIVAFLIINIVQCVISNLNSWRCDFFFIKYFSLRQVTHAHFFTLFHAFKRHKQQSFTFFCIKL